MKLFFVAMPQSSSCKLVIMDSEFSAAEGLVTPSASCNTLTGDMSLILAVFFLFPSCDFMNHMLPLQLFFFLHDVH